MPRNDRNVIIENARILFRNFAGKEGLYNREGDRSFAVCLDDDVAETMKQDGWNVKWLKPRNEDETPQAYVSVAVSFKIRPPAMIMITSQGRTRLGEAEVELLDWVDLQTVDLIINPSQWAVNGNTGIKAYLESIYMTIQEDPLQLKYAHIPEIGRGQKPLEIEAGARQDYDYEGEVVEDD